MSLKGYSPLWQTVIWIAWVGLSLRTWVASYVFNVESWQTWKIICSSKYFMYNVQCAMQYELSGGRSGRTCRVKCDIAHMPTMTCNTVTCKLILISKELLTRVEQQCHRELLNKLGRCDIATCLRNYQWPTAESKNMNRSATVTGWQYSMGQFLLKIFRRNLR